MRKQYTPQFKAKVVCEILREEKSLSQLSTEYGVHATQLRKWKRVALEKLPDLFITANRTDVVGENTVAKYMRKMGIQAIYPGPNLSKRAKNGAIYPYLL